MSEDPGRGRHRTVGANPRNIAFARGLRREMSLPEVLLWRLLKGTPMGVRFRRQFAVKGYIADFACLKARLLFEIDGIVHDMGDQPQRDMRRDAVLADHGWKVVRIAAKRVLAEPVETAEAMMRMAQARISSPERGGGSPQG